MEVDKPLNLFYSEPDPDRWIRYDRYPRKLIRWIIRGKPRPGGVMLIAINLMKGLDQLGISYRFNDYSHIRKHPEEIACIIGKPQVLYENRWSNPIIFGAGIFSHPSDHLNLLTDHPTIKRLVVPGPWMKKMFEPYYPGVVIDWPVGTDTREWQPTGAIKTIDFLIYDKTHNKYAEELVEPLISLLNKHGLTYQHLRYGSYTPTELKATLGKCKAAIFLSAHETQGLAYQQILATDTPVLAWDTGGYWLDPDYYPHRVKFRPVSSVPYWDKRCGKKFSGIIDLEENLLAFIADQNIYRPRDYILENLSLECCARAYVKLIADTYAQLTHGSF